jgi:hypothetical protein
MSGDFDVVTEARGLMRLVSKVLRSDDCHIDQTVSVKVCRYKAEQLDALADELEGRHSNRFGFRPCARVIRNVGGQVVAIYFYPGWLDLSNYGKEIRVHTYALSMGAQARI